MNFCGLGEIPLGLMNFKLQSFSVPNGIVDIKTAGDQITVPSGANASSAAEVS